MVLTVVETPLQDFLERNSATLKDTKFSRQFIVQLDICEEELYVKQLSQASKCVGIQIN